MSREAAELTRRLDWRFLLPRATFRRAVLSGSDARLRDCARRIGLAPVVVAESDGSPADLIFLPAGHDLSAIVDLAADGVVCCEVDRRVQRRLTPARLADRMRDAGLHPCGTWAVRPGLARVESFVPIDHPAPLPWYLGTLYHATTWPQRLAAACVRVLVGDDGRRLARFAPLFVMVAARPGVVDSIQDRGPVIVLTDSGDRATCLAFGPDEAAPLTVTKIPKSEAFAERTRREQFTMVDLRARLSDDIATSLPRPLGLAAWGDVAASRETVVPGVALATRCRVGQRHAADAQHDLAAASDWLARFHAATRSAAVDVRAEVETLCDRYLERFGGPASAMVDGVRVTLAHLPPIPAVMRHPDFNVWNVLRSGDRLHVIDWEGAAPGPPLCDLVQFAVHWHESVSRRRPRMPDEIGLRQLLVDRRARDPADLAVAQAFDRYLDVVSIPEGWFDVLAVTTWVELALRRERQLIDAGSPLEERDRNNFGVRYVEALANVWPTTTTAAMAGTGAA